MGRPRKTSALVRAQVMLPQIVLDAVERICQDTNRSRSDILREMTTAGAPLVVQQHIAAMKLKAGGGEGMGKEFNDPEIDLRPTGTTEPPGDADDDTQPADPDNPDDGGWDDD